MIKVFAEWFRHRWVSQEREELLRCYQITFSTPEGQRVLQHLLDNVYCRVYEGSDTNLVLLHNGRRSVIQEILETLDAAEYPDKYEVKTEEKPILQEYRS